MSRQRRYLNVARSGVKTPLEIPALRSTVEAAYRLVMDQYDPDAEATGYYMTAFVEAAGEVSPVFERKVRDIFETHLGALEPEGWYRNGDITDAFEEIITQVGDKTMLQGGIESGAAIDWDDDVETVMDALNRWNDKHAAAYRNSDATYPAGKYTIESAGDRAARVGITDSYNLTAAFAKGCSKGIVRDLGPAGSSPTIEDTEPTADEQAAWILSW